MKTERRDNSEQVSSYLSKEESNTCTTRAPRCKISRHSLARKTPFSDAIAAEVKRTGKRNWGQKEGENLGRIEKKRTPNALYSVFGPASAGGLPPTEPSSASSPMSPPCAPDGDMAEWGLSSGDAEPFAAALA